MCTIVLLKNVIPGYPLAIATNRDEVLSRKSEPPSVRADARAWDGASSFLAPRDLQRGGTWVGVNHHGVFAGLTNRNDVTGKPSRTTRGNLPYIALKHQTAKDAYQELIAVSGSDFNGFYMLVADRDDCYLLGGNGLAISGREVADGIIAVTNHGVGSQDGPEIPRRVSWILTEWDGIRYNLSSMYQRPEEQLGAAHFTPLLSIHDEDRYGTCINEPENDYGTKSSNVLLLDDTQWQYWHRERNSSEHICQQPFHKQILSLKR